MIIEVQLFFVHLINFHFSCTGNGPYVVIDNRTEAAANAQETSSEDGSMLLSYNSDALP